MEDPCQFPTGIPYVIINGVPVVDDHSRTDTTHGSRSQEPVNITGLDSLIANLQAAFPDRRRDHRSLPFGVGGHCLPGADLSTMPLETAGVIRV